MRPQPATVPLSSPSKTFADAIGSVPEIKHSNLKPQALEFFEKEMLETTEAYMGTSVFPKVVEGTEVGAYLLITLDADHNDELDRLVEQAAEMLLEKGALDVLVADVPMYLEKTWAARSSFLEGIESIYNLIDECDVVVPVSKIPDFTLYIREIAEGFSFDIRMFGHAGDGNIHVYACKRRP